MCLKIEIEVIIKEILVLLARQVKRFTALLIKLCYDIYFDI